jgi:hypothetical protein
LLQLVVCEKSLRAPTFEKKSLQEKERKKSVCWLKGAKKKKEGSRSHSEFRIDQVHIVAMATTSDLVLSVFDRAVVAEFGAARDAVTSQILSAFFGYCGDIERLLIEHDAKRAIVLFRDGDAAQTALLLDRGCVCGGELRVRAIRVDADVQLVKRLHVVMNDASAAEAAPPLVVDATRAVFVSHVAAQATPQTLADFFSFCGDVEHVRLFADPSNAPLAVAVVSFVDAKALDTALLLDAARVYDSPIAVRRYNGSNCAESRVRSDRRARRRQTERRRRARHRRRQLVGVGANQGDARRRLRYRSACHGACTGARRAIQIERACGRRCAERQGWRHQKQRDCTICSQEFT